jgi:hypothetical protein
VKKDNAQWVATVVEYINGYDEIGYQPAVMDDLERLGMYAKPMPGGGRVPAEFKSRSPFWEPVSDVRDGHAFVLPSLKKALKIADKKAHKLNSNEWHMK